VEFGEDDHGLLLASTRVEPAGGLGEEQNKDHIDNAKRTLKDKRDTPRVVAANAAERNGNTRSEKLTDLRSVSKHSSPRLTVEPRVLQSHPTTAVPRARNL
jgi:hypothetical protein